MKTLLSPEFNEKISVLDPEVLKKIVGFISSIEGISKNDILTAIGDKVSALGEELYIANLQSVRLIFTFGNENGVDYLLLMDAIVFKDTLSESKKDFFASNHPNRNNKFNPKYNTSINPKYNTSINPKYNTSINPKYNTSINPKYNTSINPKYNTSINPKYNTSINPKYNTSINPKYNASINPQLNISYGGPYVYDLDMNQISYLVKANNTIDLIFTRKSELLGLLVYANESIKIEFDSTNKWVGYLVATDDDVWLRYSINADWIGLIS